MRFRLIDLLKYAVPLVVAYLLLRYYVFKEISLSEMVAVFRQADYGWVLLSGVILLTAHWSRAYRWRLLLEPLGHRPGVFRVFLAVMIGYFANLLLPRLGEVSRCGMLQKMNRVPVNVGIGTVVAERLFDLLMLLVLLALTFLIEFNRISGFFLNLFGAKAGSLAQLPVGFYLAAAGGLLVIILGTFWAYRNQETLWRMPGLARVREFFLGMWEGVISVRRLRDRNAFLFHTLLIWVCYYFAAYTLTFALPDARPLSWQAGLTILMTGSLGMAAPVQGGTGPYHLLVSSALMLYGWTQQEGIILATFIWASQTLLTVIAGGVSFVISLFVKPEAAPKEPTVG
ncbi:MAG: flippase-like domain-containing protein [Cytophagales bacterium]|jgi:hypothetical protein|nr:flippase-like domain-containing protein [Cytophagales bacterium]